jgi:hypothetical protein
MVSNLSAFSHTLDPKRPSQMAAIGNANYQSLRRRSARVEPEQPVLPPRNRLLPRLPQGRVSACVMLGPKHRRSPWRNVDIKGVE